MRIDDYYDGTIRVAIFKDKMIDERSYVINNGIESIIIDPHDDLEMIEYVQECKKATIFLTHEHYDHISGVNQLRKTAPVTVFASNVCKNIIEGQNNSTVMFPFLFLGDREKYHYYREKIKKSYICTIDREIDSDTSLNLADYSIHIWLTTGHSPGGISILIDGKYLFSGDNLLGNGMELKSIGSDVGQYIKLLDEYDKLDGDCVTVFPGHGEVASLKDYLIKVRRFYGWN